MRLKASLSECLPSSPFREDFSIKKATRECEKYGAARQTIYGRDQDELFCLLSECLSVWRLKK